MKYLVVEYRYGYKSVPLGNQVQTLEGINICAETHDSEFTIRLAKFYSKIRNNYHIEVQTVLEDGDITEEEIEKFLMKFNQIDKYIKLYLSICYE